MDVDYSKAFRLLTDAAEQGASRAKVNLARMYAEGLGIPRNMSHAIRLYESAAKAGEFLAQVELGRIYSRGNGTEVNLETALKWYSAAAQQENEVMDCAELQEVKNYISSQTRP